MVKGEKGEDDEWGIERNKGVTNWERGDQEGRKGG